MKIFIYMIAFVAASDLDWSDIILQIFDKYITLNSLILLADKAPDDSSDRILEKFHPKYSMLIYSVAENKSREHQKTPISGCIMILRSNDVKFEASLWIETLRNQSFWNPRSRFIVIGDENILEIFSQERLMDVVVLVKNSTNNDVDLFIWTSVFEQGKRCGYPQFPVWIDQWHAGQFLHESDLFPKRLPDNFQGCYLRSGVYIMPPITIGNPEIWQFQETELEDGMLIKMLSTIGKLFNFTIRYHFFFGFTPPYLDDILSGESDLSCLASYVSWEFHIERSVVYKMSKVDWYVPAPKRIPCWQNLIRIFEFQLWLVLFFTFFCASLVFWRLTQRDTNDSVYFNYSHCLMNLFQTFVGLSVTIIPKNVASRLFYFIWILFSFWIIIAYQSKLIGFLIEPGFEKPIRTLQQILEKLNFYLVDHHWIYLVDNTTEIQELKNRREYCFILRECLERVASNEAATVADDITYNECGINQISSDGRPLIQPSGIGIRNAYYYMKYFEGSPLKEFFDKYFLQMFAANLDDFWIKEVYLKFPEMSKKTKKLDDNNQVVFNLAHLQSSFMFWFIGITASLLAFLLELFFSKYYQRITFTN